jgi:hypothetical protein
MNELLYNTVSSTINLINTRVSCLDRAYITLTCLKKEKNNEK